MNAKALQDAILADPDDDLSRLVYADWLEEHGDLARATFIRIQIREAQVVSSKQLVPGFVEYHALQRQAKELLSLHSEEWLATLPRTLRRGQAIFQRGFVGRLELPVNQLLAVSSRVWTTHPIQELEPKEAQGKLAEVLAMPHLSRIRKLYLSTRFLEQDLAALATTQNLSTVRDLTVHHGGGNRLLEALAACPSLRGLPRLYLTESKLDAGSIAALTASPNVSNLSYLRIDDYRSGATAILARSPALAALNHLCVHWSGDVGFAALADAPHFAGLRWLSARRSGITSVAVEALAATRHLTRLQILELGNNVLGAAGIRAMNGATWKDLARLDVGDCQLGDEGAIALAECSALAGLGSLSVDSNEITAIGVRALARSPILQNLTYLSLYNNEIGDEGAMALCESPTLTKLSRLGLGHCGPFSPAVEAALHERFGTGLRL